MEDVYGRYSYRGLLRCDLCSVIWAEAKSVDDMEKELNALKASVASLTEQIQSVKQDKVATSTSTNSKEEIDALRNEVHSLKEEMQTAAEGEQALKAEDITGNVYSEFAKKGKTRRTDQDKGRSMQMGLSGTR
ncbi:MAG: hypothetical protein U0586_04240 [Candidatus Brocadiaceae bacterium]